MMKKWLFVFLLLSVFGLTACGTYEENPETGETTYHGMYSDDPVADQIIENTVITTPLIIQ